MALLINPWTKKEIDKVLKLVKDGLTAAEIAKRVKGRTRNAILGMLNRRKIVLNIERPARAVKPKAPPKPRVPKAPIKRTPKPEDAVYAAKAKLFFDVSGQPIAQPKLGPLTIHKLKPLHGESNCRAVIGEIKGEKTMYCGEPTLENKSWCGEHYKRFYVVGSGMKRT